MHKEDICYEMFKNEFLKYKPNYEESKILDVFNSNACENVRKVLNDIIDKYNCEVKKINKSSELVKFKLIYHKTRYEKFLNIEEFNNISLNLSKKFKLKIYNIFKDNHLFRDYKSLFNMIGLFGLFEDDINVNKRIRNIINIFFYQDSFSRREILKNESNIEYVKRDVYVLNEEIKNAIPEELKTYFFSEITSDYYNFLRRMNGNYGRKINDFLVPYVKVGDCYKLKDRLYNFMMKLSLDSFESVKTLDKVEYEGIKVDSPVYNLINFYRKKESYYYSLKKDISLEVRKSELKKFKEYELTYSSSDIQSLFGRVDSTYNSEFYDFFVSHQPEIAVSSNNFSKLAAVEKKYHDIKKYYLSKGNRNPDFITMIEWLRDVPYDVEYGDEDFAIEAKNAGVLKEGYCYYSNLLKKVRCRYKRAIPNHNKYYDYYDNIGKKHTVETKILRGTDPMNLLIGESKYTDCCQKYNDLGQMCLEHASLSKMGGIFTVSLLEDNVAKILCQSWIWVNEQEIVLDNIEQSSFLNCSSTKDRQLYEDIIAYAIKNAAQDILTESNVELKKYVEKEFEKLCHMNDEKKESFVNRLNEISIRQVLKVFTVGANYSDIIVADYFPIKAKRKLFLPKDYAVNGYTDASDRYIVAGSEENIIYSPSDSYIEEAIYRDVRIVEEKKISEISNENFKKILTIERECSIEKLNFKNLEDYIKLHKLDSDKVFVIVGEDWYCIYEINSLTKKIVKISIGNPRLFDELETQKKEIDFYLKNMEKCCENEEIDKCILLEVSV